jgi:hypothetical protein
MTEANIAARLAAISERLENVGEDVREVKDLAKTTNGRVTALEKSRERDKGFLAAVVLLVPGATAVISAWAISVLF